MDNFSENVNLTINTFVWYKKFELHNRNYEKKITVLLHYLKPDHMNY